MAGGFEPDTAMVLGYAPYRTDAPYSTLFHRLLALEYFSIGAVAAALAGCNIPISANGANLAFRKTAFEAAGGYGESIRQLSGDDDLLLHRIRYSRRMKVRYQHIKESVVFNNPPENLARFYRQRMRFASKHGQYPPAFRFLLFGIYLMNASLFAGILQCIFDSAKTPILFLLALKALADLIFLKIAQSVLQERPLLRLYPIAFLPHILYILSVPIASRFFRTRW